VPGWHLPWYSAPIITQEVRKYKDYMKFLSRALDRGMTFVILYGNLLNKPSAINDLSTLKTTTPQLRYVGVG